MSNKHVEVSLATIAALSLHQSLYVHNFSDLQKCSNSVCEVKWGSFQGLPQNVKLKLFP